MLSPLDWALIEAWQERGIPLHIILRGIEKVFDLIDKQPNRKRTVKSLLYCKEEVEAQYAEWLESQVGAEISNSKSEIPDTETVKHELFSNSAIEEHLKQVSADLTAAKAKADGDLSETLERVLSRLEQFQTNYESAEKLEDSLEKLDNLIDETLLKIGDTEKFKPEVEKQIASYRGKMDAEVFQRTYDLMILKRLREERNIPRLSLFYI